MTDSGRPNLEGRVDRYVRGELTPAEARELAQASLESLELFEELTWSAVAKTALPSLPPDKVRRFPGKVWVLASAAAAALLLISFYTLRSLSPANTREIAKKPALAFAAHSGQPLLLATGLEPVQRDSTVFRSPVADSRAPRPTGSIDLIEDGVATINLGSLDSLAKGSELQIFRDQRATQPIGRLVVTTVFRERARGRILSNQQIPIHSEVRVAGAGYLGALLEQVDALQRQGDVAAARMKAEEAESWAETVGVAAGETGKALEKLAALEYQSGLIDAAERHLQSAADRLPPPEQSAAWNNLGAIRLSKGDYAGAATPLNQVVATSPKSDIFYARSLNNLGVLAEMRGDRRKAESFYTDALRAFDGIVNAPLQDRQAAETNVKRLKGLH